MNRKSSIRVGRDARMLCPQGCGVMHVKYQDEQDEVSLSCGHSRIPELLSKPAGTVGLEDVIAGTTLSLKLFPPEIEFKRKADTAKLLDEVTALAIREGWLK